VVQVVIMIDYVHEHDLVYGCVYMCKLETIEREASSNITLTVTKKLGYDYGDWIREWKFQLSKHGGE